MNINHKIASAIAHLDNNNTDFAWQCLHAVRRFINDCSKSEMAGVDFDALRAAEARHDAMNRAEIRAEAAVLAAEYEAADFTG